jgi:hypothetical protein
VIYSVFSFPRTPAVYAIVVRSSEYDLPPEMLDDIVSQSISQSGRPLKDGDFDDEEDYF